MVLDVIGLSMSSSKPPSISGSDHVGSTEKHREPSNNLFLHLYKECCFCMYQDVVTPKQRLLCGLSNVSRDEKNSFSSI
jgi:hypothetical protein